MSHQKLPKSLKLNECPFCDSRNLNLFIARRSSGVVWVKCNDCDADGPIKDTPRTAANAWNKADGLKLYNPVVLHLSENGICYETK